MPSMHVFRTAGLTLGLAVLAFSLVGCGADVAPEKPPVEKTVEASPTKAAEVPQRPKPAKDVPVQSASLEDLEMTQPIAPTKLTISDLAIDLDAIPQGVDQNGEMALPTVASQVGWYQHGSGLDEPAGAMILAAHVDTPNGGLAPLVRLREAVPGQLVSVTGEDGSVRQFRITGSENIPKGRGSLDAYFDPQSPYRLVMITCDGPWDAAANTYIENLVVTAELVA